MAEVKTMSAKRSIREALGQILEYAHYPYMKLLRDKYNLPIWFRLYSFFENKLYDGV